MREFVREEALALLPAGFQASLIDDDILAEGERLGIHAFGHSPGSAVVVNANLTKIGAEASLHSGTGGAIKWLARGLQQFRESLVSDERLEPQPR
jgi:hypothetical protein